MSGGSSSGSAVAVATGEADIALGTDTAGSGRVPGRVLRDRRAQADPRLALDPGRGARVPLVRLRLGVRPRRAAGRGRRRGRRPATTRRDPWSGGRRGTRRAARSSGVGVPSRSVLERWCDPRWPRPSATIGVAGLRGRSRSTSSAYLAAGRLLYGGAFVAERYAAVGAFVRATATTSTRSSAASIGAAAAHPARDRAGADLDRLARLRRRPTRCGRRRRHRPAHRAQPPDPRRGRRRPDRDQRRARSLHQRLQPARLVRGGRCPPASGPTGSPSASACSARPGPTGPCGRRPRRWWAGLPRLAPAERRGDARRVAAPTSRASRSTTSSPSRGPPRRPHRDGAPLPDAPVAHRPPKPGLVRGCRRDRALAGGRGVELDAAAFGSFVAEVPPPLAIGTVELADGTWTKGFLCEPHALDGTADITDHGGWRAWLASRCGHRGRRAGGVHDRAGPPRPARLLDGRRPAERPDGRPVVVPARQPGRRQPPTAAGLECTATGPTLRFAARPSCASAARTWTPLDGRPCPRGSRSRSAPARCCPSAAWPAPACAPTSRCVAGSTCRSCSAAGPRSPSAASAATRAGPLAAGDVLAVGTLVSARVPSRGAAGAWPAIGTTGGSACSKARTRRPTSSRPDGQLPLRRSGVRTAGRLPLHPGHRAHTALPPARRGDPEVALVLGTVYNILMVADVARPQGADRASRWRDRVLGRVISRKPGIIDVARINRGGLDARRPSSSPPRKGSRTDPRHPRPQRRPDVRPPHRVRADRPPQRCRPAPAVAARLRGRRVPDDAPGGERGQQGVPGRRAASGHRPRRHRPPRRRGVVSSSVPRDAASPRCSTSSAG